VPRTHVICSRAGSADWSNPGPSLVAMSVIPSFPWIFSLLPDCLMTAQTGTPIWPAVASREAINQPVHAGLPACVQPWYPVSSPTYAHVPSSQRHWPKRFTSAQPGTQGFQWRPMPCTYCVSDQRRRAAPSARPDDTATIAAGRKWDSENRTTRTPDTTPASTVLRHHVDGRPALPPTPPAIAHRPSA
jgi:hypothetical protein